MIVIEYIGPDPMLSGERTQVLQGATVDDLLRFIGKQMSLESKPQHWRLLEEGDSSGDDDTHDEREVAKHGGW